MLNDKENDLPDVGTPEQAKKKMIEAYASFLDSAAKFLTLGEFYSDNTHEGQALGTDFQSRYNVNYNKLKSSATPEDFGYQLSFYTLVYLDYIEDVKENLRQYEEILKGQDPKLSDYDKACDLLAIKDEFTDLEHVLNDVNLTIAEERAIETHYNDPEYDASAKELEKRQFEK
jgi:hypothetical protein